MTYMHCGCTSEQAAPLPYTLLTDKFCITEVESVYSAVRTEALYKRDKGRLKKLVGTVEAYYKIVSIYHLQKK